MFKNETAREFHIELLLAPGKYRAEIFSVSRRQGSSFEVWKDMGSPEALNHEQENYLKREAFPHYRTESYRSDGRLTLCEELEAHEVKMIILTKMTQI